MKYWIPLNILQKLNSSLGLLATILGAVGITIFQFVKEIDVYVKQTSLYNNLIKTDNLAGWCVMLVIMITIMVAHFVYLNILYRKKIKIFEKGMLDVKNVFEEKLNIFEREKALEIINIHKIYEEEALNNLKPLYNELFGIIRSVERNLDKVHNTYNDIRKDFSDSKYLMMAERQVENIDVDDEAIKELFGGDNYSYDEAKVWMDNIFNKFLPALECFKDDNVTTLDTEIVGLVESYIERINSSIREIDFPSYEDGVIYHLTNHNDERVDIVNKIKNKIKQQ